MVKSSAEEIQFTNFYSCVMGICENKISAVFYVFRNEDHARQLRNVNNLALKASVEENNTKTKQNQFHGHR